METIVGIDLGTTNSEIAVIRDGQPQILESEGEKMLPSAVGLDTEGNLLVGAPARNQAALAPERTVLSAKRSMGEQTTFTLGEESYSPQEISAMVLRSLKARAEQALNQIVTKAVITVPAYFKEAQREATRQAGELAGFEVARIINEPTAAALTYEPHPDRRERILVYDLGGGTFDVSIVQLEQDVLEVLASHGDTHLGGDDMDQLLLDHVCDRFQQAHDIDLRESPGQRSRVRQAVEEARKQLSFEPTAHVRCEFIAQVNDTPTHLDESIKRETYEGLIESLIQRTLTCVDQSLSDADLRANQIDKVVLVGGATRTPRVRQVLEEKLGQAPHGEVEPDLCVALGGAMQAGIIAGEDVGQVLVDITPHTLGLDVLATIDGLPQPHYFSPIIKRNAALPASRTEMYSTSYDGQDAAWINVVQGENGDARQNTPLGEFLLEGLSEDARGSRIPVRFDLDLNGMLTVTATEQATGHCQQLTIDSAMERFRQSDQDQARRRIDAAMGQPAAQVSGEHPAAEDTDEEVEDPDHASVSPAQREARQLLERAQTLRSNVQGEDAEDLDAAESALRQALETGDDERIRQVMPELDDLVFYLQEA